MQRWRPWARMYAADHRGRPRRRHGRRRHTEQQCWRADTVAPQTLRPGLRCGRVPAARLARCDHGASGSKASLPGFTGHRPSRPQRTCSSRRSVRTAARQPPRRRRRRRSRPRAPRASATRRWPRAAPSTATTRSLPRRSPCGGRCAAGTLDTGYAVALMVGMWVPPLRRAGRRFCGATWACCRSSCWSRPSSRSPSWTAPAHVAGSRLACCSLSSTSSCLSTGTASATPATLWRSSRPCRCPTAPVGGAPCAVTPARQQRRLVAYI